MLLKCMLKGFRVVAASTAVLLATGCSIYHPQAVDIPLINHAGDSRVDVAVAASTWLLPDVVTVNATMSYGVTDWLASQVHFNYGGENYYAQVAPGAYLPLGEHGLLEGYAGVGIGSAWRQRQERNAGDSVGSASYEYNGHFTVPFGQVNIGWHDLTGANIDLAIGFKVGAYQPRFSYRRYDADDNLIPEQCVNYTTPNLLLEPQLVFRIGGESVKFCLRGSFAWLSDLNSDESESTHFTADLFTLSAGVNFSF